MEKKLIPYSLYLPAELHKKLKKAAKDRKASQLVREGIQVVIEGHDQYKAGYNQGIRDAARIVFDCPEAQLVAVKGQDIGVLLRNQIESLILK